MISHCPTCRRKTRQIDASVYAGDYHGFDYYAPGRQCISCGSIYGVVGVGKSARLIRHGGALCPPRDRWQEPRS